MNVLTGFKYIGEKMTEFAETGDHTYLIGFEESYGYLVGTHARDKDGVVASMLIAEMAAYYKTKNMSLYEALQEIYKKHGVYAEKTVSIVMPGKDGMEKMSALLTSLREQPPVSANGMDIVRYTDYQEQTIKENGAVSPLSGLPKSNVLKYNLSDGKTYFIVRPSGTEPKIKIYLGTAQPTFDEAMQLIDAVLADVKGQMGV
jgi:phosphoglucomutase